MSWRDQGQVWVCLVALLLVAGCSQRNIKATAAGSLERTAKPNLQAEAKELPRPQELVIDLGGGVKMEFVLIRPGSFQMGSENGDTDEKPVHKVTITKPFYMGKYEVTQEQWKAVMGAYEESDHPRSRGEGVNAARCPAESVSWEECQPFLHKLGEKVPAHKFRLPAEAEWEYACRAGSSAEYCYGDDVAGLAEYAWYAGNSGSKVHPVGEKKPNAWGLHDMYGNVWEWCADVYGPYQDEGSAGKTGAQGHVLRGGSCGHEASFCRSAFRIGIEADYDNYDMGVRLVCAAAD